MNSTCMWAVWRVIFGSRKEGGVLSSILLCFKPFGIFSPSWESTYMNCRKSWGPLERCLSVGFTVKVKIRFQGAVLNDKCILWLEYECVARWNLDWDFFTIVSIILSFLMKIFFIMANNVVLPVTMFLMSRKILYILLHQTLLNCKIVCCTYHSIVNMYTCPQCTVKHRLSMIKII